MNNYMLQRWTPFLICKILYIILHPHLTFFFAFFIYYISKFLTSLPPPWTFSKHLHFLSRQFQSVNGRWHPSNIILAYFCQSLIPHSHSREFFAISLILALIPNLLSCRLALAWSQWWYNLHYIIIDVCLTDVIDGIS